MTERRGKGVMFGPGSNGEAGAEVGAEAVTWLSALGITAEVIAGFRADIGSAADELRRERRYRESLNQYIYPFPTQTVSGTTASGAITGLSSAELMGPRSGWYWDIRRITVSGLGTAAGDILNVYMGNTGSSSDAQTQNLVTAIISTAPSYSPGLGAVLLQPGQSISGAAGGSMTNAKLVTLTISGIQIQAPYLGAYLM